MANVERLKMLRDHLRKHPEGHRQQEWARKPYMVNGVKVEASCGTTMCMAGTAAVMAGHQIRWSDADHYETHGDTVYITASRVEDGRYIEDVAQEWLELERDDSNHLFMTMDASRALDLLDILIEEETLENEG